MACRPTTNESLEELRALCKRAAERGDECLSVLLAGIDLHVRAGREFELLNLMRDTVEDMREAVENTPSAQDLRRLYEQD